MNRELDLSAVSPARIGEVLRHLAGQVDALAVPPKATVVCISNGLLRDRIRDYLKARRARDSLFGPDLFADPAWDMLLDLLLCDLEGRRVSITSACLAASVPATTALRWIATLEERGLVARVADECDRRRSHLRLAEPARASLIAWGRQYLLTAD